MHHLVGPEMSGVGSVAEMAMDWSDSVEKEHQLASVFDGVFYL